MDMVRGSIDLPAAIVARRPLGSIGGVPRTRRGFSEIGSGAREWGRDGGPPGGGPRIAAHGASGYAVGVATASCRGRSERITVLGLRSAPPMASTANPIPLSRSAKPTTMPKSASWLAM